MRHLLYVIILSTASWSYSQDSLHYLSSISIQEDFASLKGNPNTSKFGEVDAVKVLYDIQNDSTYFINSAFYDYHISFCMDFLGYEENSWKFNYDNYTTTNNRDYLMGTVNHFYNKNMLTLEFSVADNITLEQIKVIYEQTKAAFSMSDDLRLFLNTSRMRKLSEKLENIPTIDADEIYKGQTFQALNQKETYGYIRFIDLDSIEFSQINTTDIVVINGTPNELPPVAGVITTDFQTPLSHITILCQNRGTPEMALKSAWQNNELRQMNGRPVYFKVNNSSFELIEKSNFQVDSFWREKRSSIKTISLYTDSSISELLPIERVNKNSINIVGGKASNFGELTKIVKQLKLEVKTPEDAFSIPFYFYMEHLSVNHIDLLIEDLLNSKGETYDDRSLRSYLEKIQDSIMNSPISQNLLAQVNEQVAKGYFKRIRFRSSTNAEDLDGFNGAGLYDSKTGIFKDSIKSFERAIKTVWASAWNYKAFKEREYFGINQKSIAMGILCHRSFPDEKANGVVITKNLYRPHYRGFVINAQYGETSVVNPPRGVNCEQMICYSDKNDSFYGKKKIVEYLSYSNILPDAVSQVLTSAEVTKLTSQISKIKKELYDKYELNKENLHYYDYGLDLEFKIYGQNRDIYIKQVRPFKN